MQNSLAPSLDLSGKLIIKVQLGDDIRRIPIHNEDITYDELVLMMQRVYRGKLSTNDDIVIKYKDEDGDLITIFDSSDLTFAIQCSRILKITLFVNGVQPCSVGDAQWLRRELQIIRDRVNTMLDRIEPAPSPLSSGDSALPDSQSSMAPGGGKDGARNADFMVRPAEGKEFDPLSTQRSISQDEGVHSKVAASFGIPNDASAMAERAGAATPDSISSVGSASSSQQRQQQQQQQMLSGPLPQPALQGASGQPVPGMLGTGYQQHAGQGAYSQGSGQGGYPGQGPVQQYSQPGAPSAATPQPQQQQQFPAYAQPAQGGYGQYMGGQPQGGPQTAQQYSQPGGAQPAPPQPQAMFPGGQQAYMQQQAPGQKFPGFSGASLGAQQSASPTPGANPYSRGPGYGAGYPRPTANYQQGYQ
ncbi:hypothetical protein ACOMHN_042884 [Nucella lapillus]